MRFARAYAVSLSFVVAVPVFAQQTSTTTPQSSPQALALLQKSLAALTGGQSITDVTLSGTARRIAGSDDESGTATLKALTSGASRMDLGLSDGQRSEVANLTGTPPAGSWSGPDGVCHAVSYHNLLTEPAWFFPAFAISRRLSTSGYVVSYIGQETHEGQTVEHVSVSQTSSAVDPPGVPTVHHLTQVDFFFDTTTLLPNAIKYNVHPDNNALVDIPAEIRFSDYRSVNGGQIPFHIQKSLNNSLVLDFQAGTVTPNSGLSVSLFNVQ